VNTGAGCENFYTGEKLEKFSFRVFSGKFLKFPVFIPLKYGFMPFSAGIFRLPPGSFS
jgi:hypothetical protein